MMLSCGHPFTGHCATCHGSTERALEAIIHEISKLNFPIIPLSHEDALERLRRIMELTNLYSDMAKKP